jgi:DNA-binding MarR family transcriptional regulator
MSSHDEFDTAMRDWVEMFMTRSMHDLMLFLKRSDLNMGQYGTLMRLYHRDHCGVSDVGTQLGITNAAASQLVDKLVQLGLVGRSEAAYDRRVRQLTLTEAGRALVAGSFNARLSWTRELADSLTPERRAAIVQAMGYLIGAARALEQPAG